MNELSFTLSIEEAALLFSLENMPEFSVQILAEAYDELSEEIIEEKLQTASHSMMARGFFTIINSEMMVPVAVHKIIDPIRNHTQNLQILSHNIPFDEVNMNFIFIANGEFTSMRLDKGVFYTFNNGKLSEFSDFFISQECSRAVLENQKLKSDQEVELDTNTLLEMTEAKLDQIVEILMKSGCPDDLIETFGVNISVPIKMTNLMNVSLTAEKAKEIQEFDINGDGFMIIDGPEESLFFSYNGNSQDRGTLSFLTEAKLKSKIASILD